MANFVLSYTNASIPGVIVSDSLYGDIITGSNNITFSFTGTALSVNFKHDYPATGKGLGVTIDGTAASGSPFSSSDYNTPTVVATGLSEGTHTVVFELDYNNLGAGNIKFKPTANLAVTGASPSVQYASGYGQAYNVDSSRDAFRLGARLSVSNYSVSGPSFAGGYNGGFQLAFKSDARNFRFYGSGSAGASRITLFDMSGNILGSATIPSGSGQQSITIDSGLAAGTVREYTLGFAIGTLFAVESIDGTLSTGASKPAARKVWTTTGTSITVSADASAWTPEVASAQFPLLVAANLSTAYFADPMGVGGSPLIDAGGGTNVSGEERLDEIVTLNPNFVTIEHACNDVAAGTSAATYQTHLNTFVTNLFAQCSNLEKVYISQFWTSYQYSVNGPAYVAAAQAVVAAVNSALGSTKVFFIDSSGFRDSVGLYDGVHPTRAGARTIAVSVANLIAPSDTTAPAFSSASIDSSGTVLTVNLTESGSQPVLPESSATGFTLSGGHSLGSGSRASNTSFTFAVSPAVAQGETVSLSYSPGNVTDSAGTPNALASFSDQSVTNGSSYSNSAPAGTFSVNSSFGNINTRIGQYSIGESGSVNIGTGFIAIRHVEVSKATGTLPYVTNSNGTMTLTGTSGSTGWFLVIGV